MATVVAGSPDSRILRMTFSDSADEPAVIEIPLDGAATDADIISIVDDYVALSNAELLKAVIVDSLPITGFSTAGKPSSSAMPLVAAIFAMEFQKVNPLNFAKNVSKQIILPAYIEALRNDSVKPHVPVTTNATLNALTVLLAANLDYVGADGAHYPGSWAYNTSSKFGTKATVTDGF